MRESRKSAFANRARNSSAVLSLPPRRSQAELIAFAHQALKNQGYEVEQVPEMKKRSARRITKDGKSQLATIRTTRDCYIAFPRRPGGWGTLKDVDLVVAASIDRVKNPTEVRIHILPAVERIILELIDQERGRRGRLYGMRRHQTVSVSEGEINYALNLRDKRKRSANGGDWLTRSGAIATRAAMRRFVAKHPAFAIESTDDGGMYLYDVESRERELADQAETAAWLKQALA
jgi:hypothetical protein